MARSSREKLEVFMLAVISGRLHGAWPGFIRFLLKTLSRLYSLAMNIRLALFEHRLLRSKTLGCQVISIGNLTVGGTGKTPVVEVFARALQRNGRKVAILSRGYKKAETPMPEQLKNLITFNPPKQQPPRIVSDGQRLLLDSSMGGDEPYMLASNLPNVCVLVDKDRVKSGRYAIQKLGCDTLILDDGFQYLRLKHRVDIVLVDRTNPFDNGFVLPRGLLRESTRHLSRATFVFITKSPGDGSPDLRRQIRSLNDKAEIAECRHTPRHFRNVFTGDTKPLEFARGLKVATLSGIAAPRGFEESIQRLGGELVYRKRFADHHRYTQQEILDMINTSRDRGADAIITTEKDAVRFPMIERRDVPVYFLRVEIELLSCEEDFNGLISRICFK
ncbi:MAG: tetraacyldisaccharide 4'-kinase [Lentisphaerae bacterium]|nr:tetraacyldisaccharide 4'-kinase [Lentisphaerota bacterium]